MEIIETVLLPASLWFIMYSMGLSLTLSDFHRVFLNRKPLLIGIASMMLVLPLVGVAIATIVAPSPALAVGFVLLATCPGGMLSNLMTDIAKGDLALSLSLSIIVSIIYLLVIPFYAFGAVSYFMGADQSISVPFFDSIRRIISITLIPVSLGVATRSYFKPVAVRLKPYIKNIATLVLVVAFGFIIADQMETLRQSFGILLFMVVLLNFIAVTIAFSLTRVGKLSSAETTAICIEHMIRQEGTAIYIAVTIMSVREMALPMIINTPVGLTFCLVFIALSKFYTRKNVSALP